MYLLFQNRTRVPSDLSTSVRHIPRQGSWKCWPLSVHIVLPVPCAQSQVTTRHRRTTKVTQLKCREIVFQSVSRANTVNTKAQPLRVSLWVRYVFYTIQIEVNVLFHRLYNSPVFRKYTRPWQFLNSTATSSLWVFNLPSISLRSCFFACHWYSKDFNFCVFLLVCLTLQHEGITPVWRPRHLGLQHK
jgi:hypothetical protein